MILNIFNKNNLILIIIFGVAIFLRFWKVPELFYFGIDEEYQTLLASSIIKDFHVIWIGLSAANIGYYIGPGLVYLHAVLLWIAKGDPIIYGYFASLIGVTTLIIFYFVIKHLFNNKTAVISTILYGFSPFTVYYDRRFWNSTFVPLTTILLFFSLIKAKTNSRWLILTTLLIASSFHIHASLFIFIPIVLIMMYRYIIRNTRIDKITILVSLVVYLMITSPLLVYDFVHNFDNLKTPFRMLLNIGKSDGVSGAARGLANINVFTTTIVKFFTELTLPDIVHTLLLILLTNIFLWFFFSKENQKYILLKIIVGFYLMILLFYPGPILNYYYLGFFPFFAIIISFFLKKINLILVILIIFFYAIASFFMILRWPTDRGLAAKKAMIIKTSRTIGDNSFYLITNQDYLYFGGWRYLFQVYGKKPAASQADAIFGWIYPDEISKEKPSLKVIVSENNGQYQSTILKND